MPLSPAGEPHLFSPSTSSAADVPRPRRRTRLAFCDYLPAMSCNLRNSDLPGDGGTNDADPARL